MSEYGRVFEEISHIRASLKAICRVRKADIYAVAEITPTARLADPYGTSVTRLIETNRLEDAKRSVALLKSQLDAEISAWEDLEKEAEGCD